MYLIMTRFIINDWNDESAWTDYGGQARTFLDVRLKAACPSLRPTLRKQLSRAILKRESMSFDLEDPKYIDGIKWFLESVGANVTIAL